MAYLIAGLGNPGAQYAETRHNIGFMAVDALASALGISFSLEKGGLLAETTLRGRKLFLLKPNTYMNHSGEAIRYWLQKKKCTPTQLMVVYDDLALPIGTCKMRLRGGAGGHNGLQNILDLLATPSFARLRLGIDRNFPPGRQGDYVLSPFAAQEYDARDETLEKTIPIMQDWVVHGPTYVMNKHH